MRYRGKHGHTIHKNLLVLVLKTIDINHISIYVFAVLKVLTIQVCKYFLVVVIFVQQKSEAGVLF